MTERNRNGFKPIISPKMTEPVVKGFMNEILDMIEDPDNVERIKESLKEFNLSKADYLRLLKHWIEQNKTKMKTIQQGIAEQIAKVVGLIEYNQQLQNRVVLVQDHLQGLSKS